MIRVPHIALRPFVKTLWLAEHARRAHLARFNEYALPDGCMHVVIRLSGSPIRILDAAHPAGYDYGYGVIGGARAAFYTREISGLARSIGATLLPGAAQALFGVSALELANRHTCLGDVWGPSADLLRERLLQIQQPQLQLELFEIYLMTRLPQVKGIHPAVAQALANTHELNDVGSLVASTGFSHRRFVELFSTAVGLTPKRFARVLRFQSVLKRLAQHPTATWTHLALDAGYSDQPHFNREFREFAGLTPEEYRRAKPASPAHVLFSGADNPHHRRG
jgi:AraC-like DNA-binding protein